MLHQKIETPFNFIIFGASGDLAKLKLFSSLYELALQKRFPREYSIIGFARTAMTDDEFRAMMKTSLTEKYGRKLDHKVMEDLLAHSVYHRGEYDYAASYKTLADQCLKAHHGRPVENVAYFAIPPNIFMPVIENLAGVRQAMGGQLRIMLEKPFGDNVDSAEDLFHFASRFFEEKDIYLLDHYMGKATVRSILALRYTNTILNLLLKGSVISNIQISALENVGVDKRIGYFESVGIVKDMIQSHLLQMLSFFTMDMPATLDAHSIKREKIHILSSLRHTENACGIVLGQYKSYLKEEGVKKGSRTPTFAAVRLKLDLLDWYNVPIYIRTGKQLTHKHTYVVVEFKKPAFYRKNEAIDPNRLVIELFPNEKIQISLVNEEGKTIKNFREVISSESLSCTGDDCLPEHGRLILEAFLGNKTWFLSFEEIIAAWRFVDKLMDCVNVEKAPVSHYEDGSEGPAEQHKLPAEDHFKWYDADLT